MIHTCPNCNKEFSGRKNKKFCSLTCKNEAYYAKEEELQRVNRHGLKNMVSNARVLDAYMQTRNIVTQDTVLKNTLKTYGFNNNGPFWVEDGLYVVGNYCLKDYGFHYKVSKRFKGLASLTRK